MFRKLFKISRKNCNKLYKDIYHDDEELFYNNLYIKDNLSDKEKFDNIVSFAKVIIDECENKNYKEHPILDLIRIVGRRLQTDYMGYLLYSGQDENHSRDLFPQEVLFTLYDKVVQDKDGDFIKISDLLERKEYSKKVNLSKDLVLPWPWNSSRIKRSLINIGDGRDWGKWMADDTNHYLDVWLPMGIVWVYGGNHSITIGIIQGGELSPKSYTDISKIYNYVRCDGNNYIDISTGNIISKVKSPEYAAIFEIGRIMNEKGISYIN